MATQTGPPNGNLTSSANSHINSTTSAPSSTSSCPLLLQQQQQQSLITAIDASFDPFDPFDEESWFFGSIGRDEARDLLLQESDLGVFVVRESKTSHGDLVLSVKESEDKVSHYIIEKIAILKDSSKPQIRYKIGDQYFLDVPSLLTFYKRHLLDTTSLTRPAKIKDRKPSLMIDYLETLSNNNKTNSTISSLFGSCDGGSLSQQSHKSQQATHPKDNNCPLISRLRSSIQESSQLFGHHHFEHNTNNQHPNSLTSSSSTCASPVGTPTKRKHNLPRLARVIQSRVPNAYDKTALTLKLGDIIKVTETHMSGQWEGELNGKKGHFPFTHVEFIESAKAQDDMQ